MSEHKLYEVYLRNYQSENGEVSSLTAYLKEDGDLVLEGYDLGKSVEKHWGDTDYEYWRTVKNEHVPKVLLELIKERFDSDGKFHEWLDSKGIPNKFDSWI